MPNKDKKLSQKAVVDNIKRNANFVQGSNHKSSGKWSTSVTVRPDRSFASMRTEQLLRHLSAVIFFYIKENINASEQEVECMYVNDRFVISANTSTALQEIFKKLTLVIANAKATTSQQELVKVIFINKLKTKEVRASRVQKKVTQVFDKKRYENEAVIINFLHTIESVSFVEELDFMSPADCKLKLTDPSYKHKLIFITEPVAEDYDNPYKDIQHKNPFKDIHAEQKLVFALYNGGVKDAATIRGKKRPCAHCGATMKFYNSYCGGVINSNPCSGGMWDTSRGPLIYLMQLCVKDKLLTPQEAEKFIQTNYTGLVSHKSYKPTGKKETSGWDSGSDSDSD